MRHSFTVLLVASLAMLGACRNGGSVVDTGGRGGDKVPVGEVALLEHEYVNHAWGYQHRGIVVAGDGTVSSYEWARGETPWPETDRPVKTGESLTEKYSHARTVLGTIGADTLALVRGLLAAAELGTISEKEARGADMGQYTRFAYRYTPESGTYTQILLRSDGDFVWSNTSPEAARLAEIVDAIAGRYQ